MAGAVQLRSDYDGRALRAMARQDAAQARRLLVLALIYEGGSRGDAAGFGGTQRQTVRDWVINFNSYGPSGLIDGQAPGQQPKLNDAQRAELAESVERGPSPLFTVSFDEASRTWRTGFGMNLAYGSMQRSWGVNSKRWGVAV